MLRIAVCDDDKEQLQILQRKVQGYLKQRNETADIELYEQSQILKYNIQEGRYFDLILSDIEMPQVDGMKLAEEIRKFLPEVLIIFVTSYLKYAIDAYELSVFRYIPKKSLDVRLPRALDDAFKMIYLQSQESYMFQTPSKTEKIPYKQIIYIQKDGKNSMIVKADGKVTSVRKSLSSIYEELQSEEFVFIDRSCIVNITKILGINGTCVQMQNRVNLPISHSRLECIKEKMNKFWGEQL